MSQATKRPLRRADSELGHVGASGLPELYPTASRLSLDRADEVRSRAPRRTDIPVRADFVRHDDPTEEPPLARLVRSGGRGGATPLKLYLGLIWLASDPPFDTPALSSRVWAELLDLDEPAGRGKKRVAVALNKLEDHRLIKLDRRHGEASKVYLRRESGDGSAYGQIPSTAYHRPADGRRKQRYFKVNTRLWTEGHVQSMSAKALAMLLVILEEQYGRDEPVWFSESRFHQRFGLSRATRSAGARELFQRRLIVIQRAPVTQGGSAFEQERVRNTYRVIGDATPSDWPTVPLRRLTDERH